MWLNLKDVKLRTFLFRNESKTQKISLLILFAKPVENKRHIRKQEKSKHLMQDS